MIVWWLTTDSHGFCSFDYNKLTNFVRVHFDSVPKKGLFFGLIVTRDEKSKHKPQSLVSFKLFVAFKVRML